MSPYSFLRFCVREGILFRYDFLPFSGFGLGSGACLPTFLSFLKKRIVLYHNFLVSCGSGPSPFFSFVPFLRNGVTHEFFLAHERGLLLFGVYAGVIFLVFWHSVPSSFPGSFQFRVGFWFFVPSKFPNSFWFRVRFWGLSP